MIIFNCFVYKTSMLHAIIKRKKKDKRIEFSDLVALKKKFPNTPFVPLFTSNWYMNSNRVVFINKVYYLV